MLNIMKMLDSNERKLGIGSFSDNIREGFSVYELRRNVEKRFVQYCKFFLIKNYQKWVISKIFYFNYIMVVKFIKGC